MKRIGIDVGGTYTDAVLMDGMSVVASRKSETTHNITSGIVQALQAVLAGGRCATSDVRAVMIGTTHFTNAVIECRRLAPVAALRLGLPSTRALPPMTNWPDLIGAELGRHTYMCHGGLEFDGRHISPLDAGELRRIAHEVAAKGIQSVAITSVFSPLDAECELRAAEIFSAEHPTCHVTLSHKIGQIGLIERENATILNACLYPLATIITTGLVAALRNVGITAPLFLSQNDGTLMDVQCANLYPVFTFSSGPTNSLRGAAFLSGYQDCVVADVGGTTTDVGVLMRGFPCQSTSETTICGIRTNFRMPDTMSIGLGGGSHVSFGEQLAIGPRSVGNELSRRALVFGGDVLTATDVAVAGGLVEIGDASLVAGLDRSLIERALTLISQKVANAADRMLPARTKLPLVLVGGGSVLLRPDVPGFPAVNRPENYAVANAIGAAISQIGGEVDKIFDYSNIGREKSLARAKNDAADKAISAGAALGTVRIVEVDEIPLTYMPGKFVRVRVKAVGDLNIVC